MNNKILLSLFAACAVASAAGYKVPEQSADGVGVAASNIATSFGADAAYYNPANMVFLPDQRHYFEQGIAWFHIDRSKFKADNGKTYKSEKFDSAASTFQFVTPAYSLENVRFGLSLAVPAALGRSWRDADAAFSAQRFHLHVIELNPSVAYLVHEKFAVAAGVRMTYTKGKIASTLYNGGNKYVEGDGIDFGYNLAMTYKPTENLNLAATYRSKVDLNVAGDASINLFGPLGSAGGSYHGKVKTSIPLPAQLTLAASYKIKNTTLLFAYDRTFWSKFDGYDFDYPDRTPSANPMVNGVFTAAFDNKVEKKYRDNNSFRLGVAHDYSDKLRLMAGFAYDQGASHSKTTSFELPDTTSYAYSMGASYKFSENLELTFSGLYQDRQVKEGNVKMIPSQTFPAPATEVGGKFDKARIWILATGIKYKF